MSNAIDLCRVSDVREWLGLNPVQQALVSTTIAASIAPGVQTVTPATMANIVAGSILLIGSDSSREYVAVTSVASTTFTATFAVAHTGPSTVTDVTDSMLSRVITAASAQWIWRTGQAIQDGSYPTHSPFVERVSYDQYYDGNGGVRMFLRNRPIATVTSLTVSGVAIPASTSETTPGYVIDSSGKSLAIKFGGAVSSRYFSRSGVGYQFSMGIQNVHVVYTAGYAQTPDDIVDASIEMVALNYKRRNWMDQKSDSKPDSIGAVRYQDWELPPKIVAVMSRYTREAIV